MLSKFIEKREKHSSTAFSNFVRNSTASEKRKLFNKIIEETIQEQRAVIEKAERMQQESA